jgi:hypothetical protein
LNSSAVVEYPRGEESKLKKYDVDILAKDPQIMQKIITTFGDDGKTLGFLE